jgi:hypothetical protein
MFRVYAGGVPAYVVQIFRICGTETLLIVKPMRRNDLLAIPHVTIAHGCERPLPNPTTRLGIDQVVNSRLASVMAL